ncbi:MAG TPA: lamin tail domain-containing protein, partial [Pyrinomonadaceae bacterium]|nr:lamin tail domain-containing protein [Pyrinomonadaceae bacterium]
MLRLTACFLIIASPVTSDNFRNNSEIYLAAIAPRPQFGTATVSNAAAQGHEPEPARIAPGSIASIHGSALAFRSEAATLVEGDPPFTVAGTGVKVNGQPARIFYASPDQVVCVVPSGLSLGPAEFVVTNAEGFSSKAEANISSAAPGVFTVTADGRGEAIALNSDTLTPGAFDPSNGQLRVSLFATGVAEAKNVFVTIGGRSATAETVARSNVAGLDEIHVHVPVELSGSGRSILVVTADGVQSNSVSVVLAGSVPSPTIVISQIYGGGGNSGAPFRNDLIEIFNRGTSAVNLAGWSVQYASATATSWSVTPLTAATLMPGQYYLVQESSGGSNGTPLPTPDAMGTIA